MSQADRKPHVIRSDAPLELDDVHKVAGESELSLSDALNWATQTCLEAVCQYVITRFVREVLPSLCVKLERDEDKEQFYYEYEGIQFRVTIERDHWDVMLVAEAGFDVEDPLVWMKEKHTEERWPRRPGARPASTGTA